jgi:hypothetical protein
MAAEERDHGNDEEPKRDTRAAEPPTDPDPEESEAGPLGNPAEDEEALANRQQERDRR